jgi:hypothetical protein
MENEFIPYEQALALKELGFDEPCINYYGKNNQLRKQLDDMLGLRHHSLNKDFVLAPLYQQAFRWFREKYKIYPVFSSPNEGIVRFHIPNIGGNDCLTFEEVELECLRKLIEIVKNK